MKYQSYSYVYLDIKYEAQAEVGQLYWQTFYLLKSRGYKSDDGRHVADRESQV